MRLTILTVLAVALGVTSAPAAATPPVSNPHRQHNSYLHKLPLCGTPRAKHKVYCANPDGLPF